MLSVKTTVILFLCFATALCSPYLRRRRQVEFTANSDEEGVSLGHRLVRENFGDGLEIKAIPLVYHKQENVDTLPSFEDLIREISGKHRDLPQSADGLVPLETQGNSDLNTLASIVRSG